jgi:murein DD-endopeptidase MepM/ murein hydrolase activator NlpD
MQGHPLRRSFWRLGLGLAVLLAWSGGPAVAIAAPVDPGPAGWPLSGRPAVVRPFRPPDQNWQAGHRGVDLSARTGDAVLAPAGGVVVFAGEVGGKPVISLDHGNGRRSTYEPVTAGVGVGTRVSAGTVIGRLAAGSHCAGGCLHWGLKEGRTYLDPITLVRTAGGALRLLPAGDRHRVAREARARARSAARIVRSPDRGFVRPVPGVVTSPYGMRFHPVLRVWKLHDGTDFGAACGTPIRAAQSGQVTAAYVDAAYGHRLLLDHGAVGGRHVVTAYNHATGYVVGRGDRVSRGQVIGFVGTTGYSTGCHLHLMVWIDGRLSDPTTVF